MDKVAKLCITSGAKFEKEASAMLQVVYK